MAALEQNTFWCCHLACERREQPVISQLSAPSQSGHITHNNIASKQQAAQTLQGKFIILMHQQSSQQTQSI
jgi:hypothetical protein